MSIHSLVFAPELLQSYEHLHRDVNLTNENEYTSLMIAYENNLLDSIQILLQCKNINVNYINEKGENAVIIGCKKAKESNNLRLLLPLLERLDIEHYELKSKKNYLNELSPEQFNVVYEHMNTVCEDMKKKQRQQSYDYFNMVKSDIVEYF